MAVESTALLKAGLVLMMAGLPRQLKLPLLLYCSVVLQSAPSPVGRLRPASTIYEGLTNCTHQVALRMDCFWPNQIIDRVFVHIHQTYFHDCALTGRLLHDPPMSVLAPFITVPVLVTLLMTAVVLHVHGVGPEGQAASRPQHPVSLLEEPLVVEPVSRCHGRHKVHLSGSEGQLLCWTLWFADLAAADLKPGESSRRLCCGHCE
ncbi:hypothetical protein INR49_029271 [Caranx melampygus]|nr:hypothetical protein INR49_029271 [Caranx melampygus]